MDSILYNGSSSERTGSSSGENGICFDWITIGNTRIYDPILVPLCIWALYIGCSRFKLFKKYKCTYLYSITFIIFGLMMTFSMIPNSLEYDYSSAISDIADLIDMDLTSTAATFFLYCGLADYDIINPLNSKTQFIFLINSILILIGWVYTMYKASNESLWVSIMYELIIGVSCGAFLVLEYLYLKKNNNLKFKIYGYLLLAGFVGGVGLLIAFYGHEWCELFGSHLNPSYVWFFLSDIAMLIISHYILISRSSFLKEPSQLIKNNRNENYDDNIFKIDITNQPLLSINNHFF